MGIFTKEYIEQELGLYRVNKCNAEQLRLDIEAREDVLRARDEAIAAGVLQSPPEPDMPRTTGVSDPTGRLASGLPDEGKLSDDRRELRTLERRIRRVEAWIEALPNRERRVIELFYGRGMTWVEVVWTYNSQAGDGGRSESALREFKRCAIKRMCEMTNRKSDTPAVVF